MNFLQLLCCTFVLGIVSANLRFGSIIGVPYLFDYTDGQDWCKPSFECDIISYLCGKIGEDDCSLTVFDSLEDRITALENDEVDIVVGRFSVTQDRAQIVDFVRPYYFSSGAKLFSLPGDKELFTSFNDLISQPICMDLGYSVAQTLVDEYGLFVYPSTIESVRELVESGFCIATITDSIFILDGLVQTEVPTGYEQPFGVAISKSPSVDELKVDIQNSLLELMVKKDGNLSVLEQWAEQYIVPQGIGRNEKLSQLSDAITMNEGEYIGASEEDNIWDAANLTAARRLSEDLVVIDPDYDEACKKALDDIYQSYQNGTSIDDLPSMMIDAVSYTYLNAFPDPTNIKKVKTLQHPFLGPNVTVGDVAIANPQIVSSYQIIQDVFLSDEKNAEEGAEFYVATPLDGQQIFTPGNRAELSLVSPTRVIKTVLWKTLQEYKDEDQPLILAGCGVGEIRNW